MTLGREIAKQIGIEWQSEKPLIFPEVWDVASARMLDKANYPILTTSASAYAWAQGFHPSERVGLEELLIVAGRIVRECNRPIIADLEGCFDRSNQYIKRGVMAALKIGCSGVFIGDGGRDGLHQLLGLMEVANRIKSAKLAAIEAKSHLFLIARTDTLHLASILSNPFEETIERANAYLSAGANIVLVGGVQNLEVVRELVQKIDGPIAVTINQPHPSTLDDYRECGVAAVSLGTGLMRSALADMSQKAENLLTSGQFVHLEEAITENELSELFTPSGLKLTKSATGA